MWYSVCLTKNLIRPFLNFHVAAALGVCHIFCRFSYQHTQKIHEFTVAHYKYIESIKFTECFGAQEVDIYFLNNIFNLKGNCVLRTLKNNFANF